MNALRAESLNVMLCFVLGAALGGLIALFGRPTAAPDRRGDAFVAEPLFTLADDLGVQVMQGISDSAQRRFAMQSNLTRLAVSDLDQAIALLPDDVSHDAVLRDWITHRLAAVRPDLAARAAWEMREPTARAALAAKHGMRWRERDPEAASEWLKGVMDEPMARELVNISLTTDPEFIARVLYEWRGGRSREQHLSALLERWAMLDSDAVFRLVQKLPAGELTSRMVQGVGASLLILPRTEVQAWLGGLAPSTKATLVEEMAAMLAASTTLRDASDWMDQFAADLPGSDVRVQWYATLAAVAPGEAQRLRESVPSDDLSVGRVRSLGMMDRRQAIEWTSEIMDEQRRGTEAREQWIGWLREDRPGALRWLQGDEALKWLEAPVRESWLKRYPP